MGFIPRRCGSTSAKACSSPRGPRATLASIPTKTCSGLEFILSLARDLGVNISGMAIILQMRERMEEMQRQIQEFVQYIQQEVLTRANAAADPSKGAIVPVRRTMVAPVRASREKEVALLCHPERSHCIAKRSSDALEGSLPQAPRAHQHRGV